MFSGKQLSLLNFFPELMYYWACGNRLYKMWPIDSDAVYVNIKSGSWFTFIMYLKTIIFLESNKSFFFTLKMIIFPGSFPWIFPDQYGTIFLDWIIDNYVSVTHYYCDYHAVHNYLWGGCNTTSNEENGFLPQWMKQKCWM